MTLAFKESVAVYRTIHTIARQRGQAIILAEERTTSKHDFSSMVDLEFNKVNRVVISKHRFQSFLWLMMLYSFPNGGLKRRRKPTLDQKKCCSKFRKKFLKEKENECLQRDIVTFHTYQ